jgi:hypothetical protein
MTKKETFSIGDNVRVYDFADRQDCYYDGIVRAVGEMKGVERYFVETCIRFYNGIECDGTDIIYPRVNRISGHPYEITEKI